MYIPSSSLGMYLQLYRLNAIPYRSRLSLTVITLLSHHQDVLDNLILHIGFSAVRYRIVRLYTCTFI